MYVVIIIAGLYRAGLLAAQNYKCAILRAELLLVAAFMTSTVSIGDCGVVVVVLDSACFCGCSLLTKFCLPRRNELGAHCPLIGHSDG